MIRPNFFIVGAPKSGTTALFEYLGQHPEIGVSSFKEIHFFGSDLRFLIPRSTMEEYQSSLRLCQGKKWIGDASVSYLVSAKAAEEIKQFSPDARIIIMLRNPIEMMYALHSQLLYAGNEDVEDFEQALAAGEKRARGEGFPKRAYFLDELIYRNVAHYSEQVERYFNTFGRANVHVIIFDDFKRDTAASFRRTLEFLGVDSTVSIETQPINPNKRVRSRLWQTLFYKNRLAHSKRLQMMIPASIRNWLRRCNTVVEKRPPMAPALRERLAAELRPEVERLGKLLGRDLSHWCR